MAILPDNLTESNETFRILLSAGGVDHVLFQADSVPVVIDDDEGRFDYLASTKFVNFFTVAMYRLHTSGLVAQ